MRMMAVCATVKPVDARGQLFHWERSQSNAKAQLERRKKYMLLLMKINKYERIVSIM